MVGKSTGHDLISIRSDNGGEYLSSEFQSYLKVEGIKHERTIPKNPEQNDIAERLNRTLVESFVLCWPMQHYQGVLGQSPINRYLSTKPKSNQGSSQSDTIQST